MVFTFCCAAAKLTAKMSILYNVFVFLPMVVVKPLKHQMAQMCFVIGTFAILIFLSLFLSHDNSFFNS
jgi:hypothetical protein